ncbi:hypothetical protein BR93DRAFT_936911 [Coniochaeta sp. PMI_546]|nr:hypothetical protein BR93DRAFT_936911 [Coniochaeta sp. PMI_546]
MTKAFPTGNETISFEERRLDIQNHTPPGEFLTWDLNKPSPSQDMGLEGMTGPGHGGQLINFDDLHQSSPDGTLSEPSAQSDVAYQLDLPPNMYKFGFDGGDGYAGDENELAMQMAEMAGHGGQLHSLGGVMDAEAVSRELFGIHGDFGDPYIDGGFGFGHGETF